MVYTLYLAAKAFSLVYLVLFCLVSINRTTCIGLALATAAVGSLQYVLELPTISVFIWGPAVIFLFVFGCYVWRPSRGLLCIFAQLWRRGRVEGNV